MVCGCTADWCLHAPAAGDPPVSLPVLPSMVICFVTLSTLSSSVVSFGLSSQTYYGVGRFSGMGCNPTSDCSIGATSSKRARPPGGFLLVKASSGQFFQRRTHPRRNSPRVQTRGGKTFNSANHRPCRYHFACDSCSVLSRTSTRPLRRNLTSPNMPSLIL
jgi:hypothetical protein